MSEANEVIIYGAAEANINYKTEFRPKRPCFGGKGQSKYEKKDKMYRNYDFRRRFPGDECGYAKYSA